MQVVELEGGMLLCLKALPADVGLVAAGDGKRMVARVSTESVDSDGDIVHQGKNKRGQGWLLEKFNASPLMTWMHDTYRPNIGSPDVRAKLGTWEGGKALFLDPFAFDAGDEFAMGIAGKYDRRVLTETSVGYIGKVWDWRNQDNRITGREFFEQELFEVAAVNRGANPDTTTEVKSQMMARMLVRPKVAKAIEPAGDSELADLREEILSLNERLVVLTNAVKAFSDCNTDSPVLSVRAKIVDERMAISHETLKRLGEVGLLHG